MSRREELKELIKELVEEVIFEILEKDDEVEGKWYKFEDKVEFLILPFDISTINEDDLLTNYVSNRVKNRFMYCLIDWKGLVNKENKIFEYSEKNKELLYNYYDEIRYFVLDNSDINKMEEYE